MCLTLGELGFKIAPSIYIFEKEIDLQTKLLKVRYMSRPKFFYLGLLNPVLHVVLNVCNPHISHVYIYIYLGVVVGSHKEKWFLKVQILIGFISFCTFFLEDTKRTIIAISCP